MSENTNVPSDPATTIGRNPVELPPPINLANIGMGVLNMAALGQNEMADFRNYDVDNGGGSSIYHPWKVLFKTPDEPEDPVSWDVVGDPVWTQAQGNSIDTLWFSDVETGGQGLTDVVGDAGYILLKIIRDEGSREATEVSLEFADEVPESGSTAQYRVIAYVDSEAGVPILQKQFEEIRIFEDLAVVNGEFQLVGLEMSHRNYYAPPA